MNLNHKVLYFIEGNIVKKHIYLRSLLLISGGSPSKAEAVIASYYGHDGAVARPIPTPLNSQAKHRE